MERVILGCDQCATEEAKDDVQRLSMSIDGEGLTVDLCAKDRQPLATIKAVSRPLKIADAIKTPTTRAPKGKLPGYHKLTADERAVVRQWARAHSVDIGEAGYLNSGVIQKFAAANPGVLVITDA